MGVLFEDTGHLGCKYLDGFGFSLSGDTAVITVRYLTVESNATIKSVE